MNAHQRIIIRVSIAASSVAAHVACILPTAQNIHALQLSIIPDSVPVKLLVLHLVVLIPIAGYITVVPMGATIGTTIILSLRVCVKTLHACTALIAMITTVLINKN